MKRILLAVLLVLGPAQIALATSTEAVFVISGGVTAGPIFSLSNIVNYSNLDLNGWNFAMIGNSQSPSASPFGLYEISFTASCDLTKGCATDDLKILLSDTNFTQPVSGFVETFNVSFVGSGSTSQSAYWNSSNLLFDTTTPIGTLGPFSAFSSSTLTGGGPAGPGPYSLTMAQIVTHGSQLVALNGQIQAVPRVPESGSVLLLGAGLAGLALWEWRRVRVRRHEN